MLPDAVHVIDDDEAVRESLAFLLGSAGFTVKAYASGRVFLADLPPQAAGGCIITDVFMPELAGLELLNALKERQNTIPVIVVTGQGDIPLAVEAMRSGAFDFLEKPFDDEILLKAVRGAFAQQQEQGRQSDHRSEIVARFGLLTQRERQVLDGLIAGRPNKVIAYDLGISIRTIEIYRANVMTKMRATSLSDLIRMTLAVPASQLRQTG